MLDWLAASSTTSDAMELLKDVRSFYEESWSKLIWLIAGLGTLAIGFGGIVIPLWLERKRERQFRLDKSELARDREELLQKIEATRIELRDHAAKVAEKASNEVRLKGMQESAGVQGCSFAMLGDTLEQMGKPEMALPYYTTAARMLLIDGDTSTEELCECIGAIVRCVKIAKTGGKVDAAVSTLGLICSEAEKRNDAKLRECVTAMRAEIKGLPVRGQAGDKKDGKS